jgi:putative transcriptional regulator
MSKSAVRGKSVLEPELAKDLAEAFAFIDGRTKTLKRFKTTVVTALEAEQIKAVRKAMNLSQSKFASMLNTSISTVTAWEQGRRRPDGIATLVLLMMDKEPKTLLRLAGEAHKRLQGRQLARA